MISIKKASREDAKTISLLGQQTFKDTFGYQFTPDNLKQYLDEAYDIEEIKKSLCDAYNIFWIASVDDVPVGYAKIKLNSFADGIYTPKQIQLEKIYVLKNYIGTKVGASLMNIILSNSVIGKESLIWLIVSESNSRAIKFYERYGFLQNRQYDYIVGEQISKCSLMTKTIQ